MLDDAAARRRAALAVVVDARLAEASGEAGLEALLRDVDAIVVQEVGRAGPSRIACRAGCAACCTVNVGTLAIEGAVAAAHLRRTLAAAEIPKLTARLRTFHADVRWLEDRERVRGAFRCPLLDARRACRIHPVRPLACRGVTSLAAEDCEGALACEEEDGPPLVRMNLLQRSSYEDALDAVRQGVRRRGLDAQCRDVSGMTALFLADPELLRGYLAGAELPTS